MKKSKRKKKKLINTNIVELKQFWGSFNQNQYYKYLQAIQ